MISATRRSAVSTSAATRYCAANIAGSAHHVARLRRRSTVLLELIVAAFIATYVLLDTIPLGLATFRLEWPQMQAPAGSPSHSNRRRHGTRSSPARGTSRILLETRRRRR